MLKRGRPGNKKPRLPWRGKFGRKGEGAMICPRPHAPYRDSPSMRNRGANIAAGPVPRMSGRTARGRFLLGSSPAPVLHQALVESHGHLPAIDPV